MEDTGEILSQLSASIKFDIRKFHRGKRFHY